MTFEVLLAQEVVEFIDSQSVKMQANIEKTIDLLREFGYQLPMPYSKRLAQSEKLKELRVKHGSDICRLFYFHFKNRTYIVTSGYVKKQNKTDKREIKKAIGIMNKLLEELS